MSNEQLAMNNERTEEQKVLEAMRRAIRQNAATKASTPRIVVGESRLEEWANIRAIRDAQRSRERAERLRDQVLAVVIVILFFAGWCVTVYIDSQVHIKPNQHSAKPIELQGGMK
jgi:hypothetical protein